MNRNYAIEIDESLYYLSGKEISDVDSLSAVDRCKFLVSDLERSISRVMTVDSETKYAEAVVVRSLQEEGEFDEPVSVITKVMTSWLHIFVCTVVQRAGALPGHGAVRP